MKNCLLKLILFIGIVLLSSNTNFAQTKNDLKQKQIKTQERIKLTNELLKQTEKSKSAGLNKLLIIKKRIALRERLILEINEEINLLENEIEKNKNNIAKYENDIKVLKEEYARMIYFAYKNRNNFDRMMFIMAAKDFNQAYRRMRYFKEYSNYRKKQAEKIVVMQKNLEYETEQMQEQKNERIKLLANKERERTNLNNERSRKNNEVNRLKQKESELRKQIRKNEKIMMQLKNAIADLIAREAKGNKTYKTLSAEEEIISQAFKSSQGKLNWPIDNAVVLQEFGPKIYIDLKGIVSNNNGIDIGVVKDSKVKSIFKGEVKKVFGVPGANMAIIVRHGHYLTLYSNIVNVRVKQGDKINAGFYIGDVYNSVNNDGVVLHIEIYEEMTALNPKNWLTRQ
jgi:septal ring factor EnvC (AmiA/AmiB activator)